VQFAAIQRQEAESKYVNWMVAYEFPSLSALASRMDGIGSRVREEELALYVRRNDVMTVIKELDLKKVEESVSTMRKRLDKHFLSPESGKLVPDTWEKITDRMVSILFRLQEAALGSYQITLTVGPSAVKAIYDKFSLSP
jgi:hypothetical protein